MVDFAPPVSLSQLHLRYWALQEAAELDARYRLTLSNGSRRVIGGGGGERRPGLKSGVMT